LDEKISILFAIILIGKYDPDRDRGAGAGRGNAIISTSLPPPHD
jgi:hypothetical protein